MKFNKTALVGLLALAVTQPHSALAHGGGGELIFSSTAGFYAVLISTLIHEDGYREGRRDRYAYKQEARIQELREMATQYLIQPDASHIFADSIMQNFKKKAIEQNPENAKLSDAEFVSLFLASLDEMILHQSPYL